MESTIKIKDFPSPLKMARELLAVVAPNATVPEALSDTSVPNELNESLVDAMVTYCSVPSRNLKTPLVPL